MKKIGSLLFLISMYGGALQAQAFYETNNCHALEIGAEWLYWCAEQSQMEFGANVALSTSGINSTILRPNFDESSGYRIYADYALGTSCWFLGAQFTHLPSSATKNVFDNPAIVDTNFITLFTDNFPLLTALQGVDFSSIATTWDLDMNSLDIEIARQMCWCSCLDITPYLGLRGLWMEQKFRLNGGRLDGTFAARLKEDFNAYGLEGGLRGNFIVGYGFALIGQLRASLLYSRVSSSGDLSFTGLTGTIHYEDLTYKSLVGLESFIGVQYCSYCWNYFLEAHLGWENHLIFNTNQFTITGGGNLTMQGLTLGCSVGF